jgi:hypothetical protein
VNNAEPCARVDREAGHVGARKTDRVGIGQDLAGELGDQRGFAGPVGADDADDAARRQAEIELVDEELVAEALAELLGHHDRVAQTRARGDLDLHAVGCPVALLGHQRVVGLDTRLVLGLARARARLDPFELALERLLAVGFLLLFERQALLLLVEPRRVVAFPRNALAAVEF